MLKKIKYCTLGLLLTACGLWLLWLRINDVDRMYDALPDHDYLSEINSMIRKKQWNDAKTLCEDIIKAELPCAPEAERLMKQCDKESSFILNRAYKVGRGFITGSPDSSIEELSGSIASDMVLYGDLRDLTLQALYFMTGRKNDPVITALAVAGIATELTDFADWMPSFLKTVKKSGSMTAGMASKIVELSNQAVKQRKMPAEAKTLFSDSKSLVASCGVSRAGNIFKRLHGLEDLAHAVQAAKKSPHLTALSARHCTSGIGKVFKIATEKKHGMRLLKNIARTGKIITRAGKILYKGQWEELILQIPDKFYLPLCILFLTAGAVLLRCGTRKNKAPAENS